MKRLLASLGGGILAAGLGVGGLVYAHEGEHKEGKDGKTTTITGS